MRNKSCLASEIKINLPTCKTSLTKDSQKRQRTSTRNSSKRQKTYNEDYLFAEIEHFTQKTFENSKPQLTEPAPLDVQELLNCSFEDKYGIDWKCDACDFKNQKTVRKNYMTSLPVVLLLSLQRFSYDYENNKFYKLNSKVKLRDQIVIERRFRGVDVNKTPPGLENNNNKFNASYNISLEDIGRKA